MDHSDKDFNSIVLGALLHDIGKFLHRGKGEYEGTHEEASYKFLQKHREQFSSDLYDIDLVSNLARFHGTLKKEALRDTYFADKGPQERERIWKLISIVKRSDSYSCSERDTDQQRKRDIDKALSPLDSIFSFINLDNRGQKNIVGGYRHDIRTLHPLTSFPEPLKEIDRADINELITEFEKNLPSCSVFQDINDVLNWWLSYLEKYVWAVPSDTRYEISDISLFDHLRASAAISACLYKRHVMAIEELKHMPKADEFVLVGGDFSGIQNYIFDVTNRGSGGASKRLRARSFFVSLLSEAAIHKILHSLDLPLLCNIFSAGGKFLLLVPNISGTGETLTQAQFEIETQLHETFFSQFSFLLSWTTVKGFRWQFGVGNFFKIADEMFHRLETEKLRKSKSFLLDNGSSWRLDSFKATQLYATYSEKGDCKICGKGPGVKQEDADLEEGEEISWCCPVCYRDKYVIGRRLPQAEYVVFGKGLFDPDQEDDRIVLFRPMNAGDGNVHDGYYVRLLNDVKSIASDQYLVYRFKSEDGEQNIVGPRAILRRFYANHVPIKDNRILSFKEIADKSEWRSGDHAYGNSLLGVLKADIDNLGLIFSRGFGELRNSEKISHEFDRKTVSRFLTLSRMTDLFFSGWINDIMAADKEIVNKQLLEIGDIDHGSFEKYLMSDSIDFRNIYTVYSGGDDLVLVGPWETMIIFALHMNTQFTKYTCCNDDVTLSAGLAFVKERHPIANAIKQADELLEKSKMAGKKAISLFNTTVEWKRLPELVNFFLLLNKNIGEDSAEINNAFLYRLLEYQRMAMQFIQNNKIEGLKYMSALSYDIGRNIAKKDKDGNIVKGYEISSFLKKNLIDKNPREDNLLIHALKIPLFWCLYRNRGGVKRETVGNI